MHRNNRDWDNRNDEHRIDRRENDNNRYGRMENVKREKNRKLKALGGGLILGGLLGVLIATHS